MRYRKFVFVVHIEFTIDVSIRNPRITIVLSNYAARNDTNVVNIKHFMVKSLIILSHLLKVSFFFYLFVLTAAVIGQKTQVKIRCYAVIYIMHTEIIPLHRLPAAAMHIRHASDLKAVLVFTTSDIFYIRNENELVASFEHKC